MNKSSDEDLVGQLQRGQVDALDELYDRYAKKLYVFCYNITRSEAAEDLVHDVFAQLIRSAHTYNPRKASFRTWLFRVARNRCIDFLRREKRIRFLPIGEPEDNSRRAVILEQALADPGASVEASVIQTELAQAVRDCIDELDGNEKQAIVLYYVAGQVYREIGEVLNKSTSMAHKLCKSAQDQVQRCLESKGIRELI